MYVNVMWTNASVNYPTLINISNGEISNVKEYIDSFKNYVENSFSWLVVGIGLMGFPLWIQYNRSAQLE